MIETFNRLLSFVNLTNPATETKSVWVGGRRAGALFFARHLDYFNMTRNFTAVYRDLVPSRQITVTLNFSAIYRDWQKTQHRDPSLALWAGSDGT
jgi:hypothetical protein